MAVKTILCYGDSNTWGFEPGTRRRLGPEVRWTGVARREMGEGYRVIEEGLSGRTTVWEDPLSPGRDGKAYLPPCLESHRPLDLVTIMLGTNDLKRRFGPSASAIAEGAVLLADMARASRVGPGDTAPSVLLMVPPPVARLSEMAEMFAGAEEKSRALAYHFRWLAEWHGHELLDTGETIVSSDLDGIHVEAGEHAKLGRAVASRVRALLT